MTVPGKENIMHRAEDENWNSDIEELGLQLNKFIPCLERVKR